MFYILTLSQMSQALVDLGGEDISKGWTRWCDSYLLIHTFTFEKSMFLIDVILCLSGII